MQEETFMHLRKSIFAVAIGGALLATSPALAQGSPVNNQSAGQISKDQLEGSYLTPEAEEDAVQVAKDSDQGQGAWAVKPQNNGDVQIGVSGVEFREVGSHTEIVDADGQTVEKLVESVTLETGETVDVHYSIVSANEAIMQFTSDEPSLQKPQWRCYTDAVNGGAAAGCITGAFFGGVGCGPGALAGITGGIANAAFNCSK
ncbi:hypothetical protein [Corynebacterium glyciniphilum]|uniref:hypothetical protein n=1 Tax=Corynebacterium glyciniphilum TaxID=1404244 RepID=UPI002655C9FF|nr:hypothetical protein [Corynebacterium glyciniphilum]MDN5683241.1 hypothetical protein [Corynebacterium glyciniphilum]